MSRIPTYILAPDFSSKPDTGPIQLGNIIANPLRPSKVLSRPVPSSSSSSHSPSSPSITEEATPEVEILPGENLSLTTQEGRSAGGGLFAHFLSIAGTQVSSSRDDLCARSFSAATLETRYLVREPCADDPRLLARLREPAVRAAMRGGLFGSRPVYIVTGVKIARDLAVAVETRTQRGASLGGEAAVPGLQDLASAGAHAGAGRSGGMTVAATHTGDVVFAYQVHEVSRRGKKVGVCESDDALLHDDGEAGAEGEEDVSVIVNLDSLESSDRASLLDIDGVHCLWVAQ